MSLVNMLELSKFRNKEAEEALKKNRQIIKKNIENNNFSQALQIASNATKCFMQKKSRYDYYNITPYNNIIQNEYKLSDYINASIVETEERLYLAAQMPKKQYFSQFIEFVKKSNVELIVSLLCFCDGEDYFSDSDLSSRERILFAGRISGDKSHEDFFYNEIYDIGKTVRRIKFCSWVDHQKPGYSEMSHFYDYFRKINPKSLIIHCHAGVGRTGTFIMYDILKAKETVNLDNFVDAFLYLRSKRPEMVFSQAQLEFLSSEFL